ncbi:hypothetical protein Pssp01_01330 [Pseudomonas sp. NBRC 100443]|nr:hypothetical protein Pssp01_01330 [Pseudomonas sp. NBRC 100443]
MGERTPEYGLLTLSTCCTGSALELSVAQPPTVSRAADATPNNKPRDIFIFTLHSPSEIQ